MVARKPRPLEIHSELFGGIVQLISQLLGASQVVQPFVDVGRAPDTVLDDLAGRIDFPTHSSTEWAH